MCNLYDWVPFFKEMATKLLAYENKQAALVSLLRNVNVDGIGDRAEEGGIKRDLINIDPFTFTSLIVKHGNARKIEILEYLRGELEVVSPVPTRFSGMPNVIALKAWYFAYGYDRNPSDIPALWALFRQAVNGERIDNAVFNAALAVKNTGKPNLTQGLFRVNPDLFFPVDQQTRPYLSRLMVENDFQNIDEYLAICDEVKYAVSQPLYVQSHQAWFLNKFSQEDEAYQTKALEIAAEDEAAGDGEPNGPINPPDLFIRPASRSYKRDVAVAAEAIRKADFKCEIDNDHPTFLSQSSKKPYVEAHHLVPFGRQIEFNISIDVPENVVALCPSCHKLLHHGVLKEKRSLISRLHKERKDLLKNRGIHVTIGELLRYYSNDLQDDLE